MADWYGKPCGWVLDYMPSATAESPVPLPCQDFEEVDKCNACPDMLVLISVGSRAPAKVARFFMGCKAGGGISPQPLDDML